VWKFPGRVIIIAEGNAPFIQSVFLLSAGFVPTGGGGSFSDCTAFIGGRGVIIILREVTHRRKQMPTRRIIGAVPIVTIDGIVGVIIELIVAVSFSSGAALGDDAAAVLPLWALAGFRARVGPVRPHL
jgi:hypothetical protein